jgi:formate hydrogenlyase subunit 6/NADH:ubiquinone oxidoreductase subunit I
MLSMLKTVIALLVRGPVTRRYPAERRAPFAHARGVLSIEGEKCVYCGLCVRRCPAGALVVAREPKSWTLDPGRCIVCAACVEACPKKCLAMQPGHDASPLASPPATPVQ